MAESDAWILTTGLNNGVSKLVGEGISQYRLLRRHPKDVVCIGLTMWGTINEKTRIDLKKASQIGASDEACKRQIRDDVQEDKETLDPHHTHCILFDSGNLNEYLSDSQRSSFVQYVCDDKNSHACYAVTIVVEGGLKTPQVVQFDIDNGRPVVIIHGSGRMADVLSNLIELTTDFDQNKQRFASRK
ncbi:unnamed protein product [Rotaria sordida]|uniref:TRPM SLOG domain-containing protein n=1 Tax=Rotaria sordida TaxID=392033 RepID=A0A814I511_9BILA|nr:unnamed protein product [Rotaria sordida]